MKQRGGGAAFHSEGPNTLRGGERTYSAKTLYSNWYEDRMDPRFPGSYHGSQTEYEARNQEALSKSDPYYGAALTAHMENIGSSAFDYDNLVSPDKRLSESTWKSVTKVCHEDPRQQMENSTKLVLGADTNILSLTSAAALKPARQYDENELTQYTQRWIRDAKDNVDLRFMSSQSSSMNEAVSAELKKTASRILPGTPKSFEFFREKLLAAAGAYAIRMIGKSLKMLAGGTLYRNEPYYVNWESFNQLLKDCKIEFSVDEFKELAYFLDKEHSGQIDISLFYHGLKGEMSAYRKDLTERAFRSFSDDGQFVSLQTVCRNFDPRGDPDVAAGRISTETARKRFLSEWKKFRTDQKISIENFLEYYADISAAIDIDKKYKNMIENTWHVLTQEILDDSPSFCVLLRRSDGAEEVVKAKKHPWLNVKDKEDIMNVLRHQGYSDIADVSIDF